VLGVVVSAGCAREARRYGRGRLPCHYMGVGASSRVLACLGFYVVRGRQAGLGHCRCAGLAGLLGGGEPPSEFVVPLSGPGAQLRAPATVGECGGGPTVGVDLLAVPLQVCRGGIECPLGCDAWGLLCRSQGSLWSAMRPGYESPNAANRPGRRAADAAASPRQLPYARAHGPLRQAYGGSTILWRG
jgi:hypothetical protein